MEPSLEVRLRAFTFTLYAVEELAGQFLFDVATYLETIGYDLQPADDWMLGFVVQTEVKRIKSDCNITTIPDALLNILVKRVVGSFLHQMFFAGKLTGQIDFGQAVKQIQEGDTSLSFAVEMLPEAKFCSLVANLKDYGQGDVSAFRKIRW